MTGNDSITKGAGVSETGTKMDEDDKLDQMVQRASVPSLASLFKQGKEQGLIKPTSNYGSA